jgi:sugar phosphate isomerase/epimerase
MSLEESVETLVTHMKLAKRLGFTMVRPTTGPVQDSAPELIYESLPHAERLNIKIAPEIHSPIQLRSKYIENYLELIAKTGTKHFGFTLDLGIFCERVPRILCDYYLRHGASEAVVNYVTSAFSSLVDSQTVAEEVRKMSSNPADQMFAMVAFFYGPPVNDPKDISLIAPHILNVHGKFYEMTEEIQEYSIPYHEIVPRLIEYGCSTYINSEFEGQRLTQDAFETDSCEQIRRNQLMLKRLLGEE